MTGRVVAATDGSAINNPHGPAGWAWYISDTCWASGGFGKASNQVAELFAVLALLRAVPRERALLVRTDSQFTINVATKWMAGWKRRNWVKADGQPVANLALIKELDLALTGRDVRFEWVRGHNGDRMNEIADRLCTAASRAIKTGQPVAPGPGWTGAPDIVRAPSVRLSSTEPRSRGLSPEARAAAARAASRPSTGYTRPPLPEPKGRVLPQPHGAARRDIAPPEARIKQNTAPIGSCPSCGTPIHPISLECKCSR